MLRQISESTIRAMFMNKILSARGAIIAPSLACGAAIKVRTADNQDEKVMSLAL
jgi:hypothetical protein